MIYVSITKQLMHYCYSYDTSKYSTNLKSFIRGGSTIRSNPYNSTLLPVTDPDLQIRGGGGAVIQHPDTEISGGEGRCGLPKKFFSALWASFWLKNKWEWRALQVPPLDLPLLLHTIFDKKGIPLRFIYMYILLTNAIPFTYQIYILRIPVNCCKYTVFEIWINHKTKTFSQLFQSIKCIC